MSWNLIFKVGDKVRILEERREYARKRSSTQLNWEYSALDNMEMKIESMTKDDNFFLVGQSSIYNKECFERC